MMKPRAISPVQEAIRYYNLGYVLEGVYQYNDGSGFTVLDNPEDIEDQKTIDLPTRVDIEKLASKFSEDIQKLNI